jgi:GNAT superfamily N-acetyltransferase
MIRRMEERDAGEVFRVVNEASQAYRGVIPADRWHEPYMPMEELRDEIAAGVEFYVYAEDGPVRAVMGIQDRGEVTLIRHAYTLPSLQKSGMGTALIRHLLSLTPKPVLVGTWAAAWWAIRFYERNGFRLTGKREKDMLLKRYWNIPGRQVATSVVLADEKYRALFPAP